MGGSKREVDSSLFVSIRDLPLFPRSLPCSAAVLAASYWVFGRGGTKLTRYGKGVIMLGCTGAAFAVSHYKTLQQDPVYTKLVKQVGTIRRSDHSSSKALQLLHEPALSDGAGADDLCFEEEQQS